jgi:hypothetical protein
MRTRILSILFGGLIATVSFTASQAAPTSKKICVQGFGICDHGNGSGGSSAGNSDSGDGGHCGSGGESSRKSGSKGRKGSSKGGDTSGS